MSDFGGDFYHPHLRGATVHDWPLHVFSDEDAAAQLPILRAIAFSDLHNLVYRADHRILLAVTANRATPLAHELKQSNKSCSRPESVQLLWNLRDQSRRESVGKRSRKFGASVSCQPLICIT